MVRSGGGKGKIMNARGRIFFLMMVLLGIALGSPGGSVDLWAAESSAVPSSPTAVTVAASEGKALLTSGIDHYNNSNYRQAMDDLLAALKTQLTPEERMLAFQYLGFVHMAYNREREAVMAFEEAVKLNPSLSLDPATVSPKILEVFRRAKSRIVKTGNLVVTTIPSEAEVFLDGKSVGKTPLTLREILVGIHKVKVARENHAPEEREVEIKENQDVNLNFSLVLNAGTLSVVSEPAGVMVYLDEVPQGKTPVVIKNILAGEHIISLREGGLEEYADKLLFKPGVTLSMEVKMVESFGSALINSVPSESEVFIGGKLKGKTPLFIEKMPSGKHNILLIKAGVGKWEGELVVKRGLKTELTGELRASLIIVPPLAGDGQEPEGPQYVERINRFLMALKELNGLNLYIYDKQKYPNLFKELGILPQELAQKSIRETLNPDQLLWSLQALARELKVDLVLVGVYKDKPKGIITWNLFNTYHVVPDVFEAKVSGEEKDIKQFRQHFQSPWHLSYPWLGLVTVETWLAPYPLVGQVQAGGPVARAGIEPGDQIVTVDNQKIKSHKELQALIAKKEVGENIAIEILRKKTPTVKTIKLEAATSEIPLEDPRILYNVAMVDLGRLEEAEGKGDQTAATRLNMAVCYMHFHEWEKATEILETIKFSSEEGICQGTAFFRLGQCYEALEQWKKAAAAYEKAQNFSRCTLMNPDGPLAFQEAAIRLQYLIQRNLAK